MTKEIKSIMESKRKETVKDINEFVIQDGKASICVYLLSLWMLH